MSVVGKKNHSGVRNFREDLLLTSVSDMLDPTTMICFLIRQADLSGQLRSSGGTRGPSSDTEHQSDDRTFQPGVLRKHEPCCRGKLSL